MTTTTRRRRRTVAAILLLGVGGVVGTAAWAIIWATTATPAGSAGLDRTLAELAAWPSDPSPSATPGAGFAAWNAAIEEHEAIRDAVTAAVAPGVYGLGALTILDLDDPDDAGIWPHTIESATYDGRSGSGLARDLLRARAKAIRSSGLVARLAALSAGPRPAPTADQFAAMGYGTELPLAVLLNTLGRSRDAAKDLAGIVRMDAAAGELAMVPDLMRAIEGVARGAEAHPGLVPQLVSTSIRAMAWETASELAARGWLDVATIDRLTADMAGPDTALPAGLRTDRALTGERAVLHGMLGHMYDARGRALVAEWGDFSWDGSVAGGPLANLLGLVAPRRDAVAARLDEVLDGTGPAPDRSPGAVSILGADFLVSLLAPALDRAREHFDRAETFDDVGRVAFAVARHAAVTGSPPESLDELEAFGLPAAALADPAGTGRLGYVVLDPATEPRGISWRVWSAGADPDDPRDDVAMPARDRP
jgi:hypothetical protein